MATAIKGCIILAEDEKHGRMTYERVCDNCGYHFDKVKSEAETGGVLYEKIFGSSGIGRVYIGNGVSCGNSGGGQFLKLEMLAMRT